MPHCAGVGAIHLFDHGSNPKMSAEVQDYIDSGYLTYDFFEGHHKRFKGGFSSNLKRFSKTAQGYAYNTCLEKYGRFHSFVGFLDVDEFLVTNSTQGTNITSILKDYESYGGLSVHWRLIGSSGHSERPGRPVTQAYTMCLPEKYALHRQIKSFVNTR